MYKKLGYKHTERKLNATEKINACLKAGFMVEYYASDGALIFSREKDNIRVSIHPSGNCISYRSHLINKR